MPRYIRRRRAGRAGGLGIEDGAGAEHDGIADLAAHLADHIDGVGHGERNLGRADAPVRQRLYDLDQRLARLRAPTATIPASTIRFNVASRLIAIFSVPPSSSTSIPRLEL